MRLRIVTLIIWSVLLGVSAPYALGQTPTPARRGHITLTATLESIHTNGEGNQVRFYLLWAKEVRARPVGHVFADCSRGPNDVFFCSSIFSLPLGKITTIGMIHHTGGNSSVITGGTRSARARRADHPGYANIRGTLVTVRLSAGTFKLMFLLEP